MTTSRWTLKAISACRMLPLTLLLSIFPLHGASPYVTSIQTLRKVSGRVDWSRAKNIIAYDYPGSDGYFDVYTMNPDGSGDKCLTCDRPELPNLHQGNPAFDPTGNWIVFMVQKGPSLGKLDYYANPGAGANCDIWIMDAQATHFWQITNVERIQGGVLHPHFSHKGNKIQWVERYSSQPDPHGTWKIKVGDFSVQNGVPTVTNIQTYEPGKQGFFYETHGFSKDDSKIYYCGSQDSQNAYFFNIYSLDLESGAVTNLTGTTQDWNEHADLSSSGNGIVWMSSMGIGTPTGPGVSSDYWLMYPDGGVKTRLTYFNDPSAPEYVPNVTHVTSADNSWSPDGNALVATLIYDQATDAGAIVVIHFNWTATTVQSANFQPLVAAESIVSAFGRGLATDLAVTKSTNLPTSLDGTVVKVKDSAGTERVAPLFFVSHGQVNYLVPVGTAPGKGTVKVWIDNIVVSSGTLQVQNVAPGIYTENQDGKGVPAAYVQRVSSGGTQTYKFVFQCDAHGGNCVAAPIDLTTSSDRVFLNLFATGVRGAGGAASVSLKMGTVTLPVQFAGAQGQYPGLDQVVLELPKSLGSGGFDATLMVDGIASNTVHLEIR